MSEELALDLMATRHDLASALQMIEQYCQSRNIGREGTMRVLVVVEELFTNSIKYGYGGETDRPVRITLRHGARLALTYEDDASAFDPTRWSSETAPAPAERHAVGQAGIPLVLGLATSARYERRGNTNCLVLELPA
jgi:serine/threonine-protein kinase RsbW